MLKVSVAAWERLNITTAVRGQFGVLHGDIGTRHVPIPRTDIEPISV